MSIPETWKIERRENLPEVLRFLLQQYPRDGWRSHPNMGSLTRFWLSRHANFRKAGTHIRQRNSDLLEGYTDAVEYLREMGPSLNAFLQGLTQHHTIEDQHYFPQFMQLEPKLVAGFELLDKDHHALHDAMDAVVTSGNAIVKSEDINQQEGLIQAFVSANEKLVRFLTRHLEDEEDLVVPLILDRNADHPMG